MCLYLTSLEISFNMNLLTVSQLIDYVLRNTAVVILVHQEG